MQHHRDNCASVSNINWLSGLHIHPSYHLKVYQSLRSNRESLSHMFGRKILSWLETLHVFVTPCWITVTAPPVLLWTAAWVRLMAFHLRGNRSAQRRHVDGKNGHFLHSCTPCVPLSVMFEGGGHHRRYAELMFPPRDENRLFHASKTYIKQLSNTCYTCYGHVMNLTPFCQQY